MSYNNLGVLLKDTGKLQEAETACTNALAIHKQLVADFPSRPEFRQELAGGYNNLGILLSHTDKLQEAAAAYIAALAIQKQLATEFRGRPEFRQELARGHSNLGILLAQTGKLQEAATAYADALAIYKQLVADLPTQPDLSNELAATFNNLAHLCNQRRDFAGAKTYLQEAQPHHQAALHANPRNPRYRQFYRNNLFALVRAHSGLLDHAGALRAAEKVRDLGWDSAGDAYDAACALALGIPIVEKDDKLAAAKRQVAIRFYGDQAMAMLRGAVAKGWKNAVHMQKDSDLDALRKRDDFKKLLADLEAKAKP
jgi:tetratricopeptide (TPR) repeat protein